jgi:hypothetical protein
MSLFWKLGTVVAYFSLLIGCLLCLTIVGAPVGLAMIVFGFLIVGCARADQLKRPRASRLVNRLRTPPPLPVLRRTPPPLPAFHPISGKPLREQA